MKKLDLGQMISILANIGVLAGIVFLAVELQQNTEELQAQSRTVWVDRQISLLETMMLNPEFVELVAKDRESLTNTERARINYLGFRTLVIWEDQYGESNRGRLDEQVIIRLQKNIAHSSFNDLGISIAWPAYKRDRASPGFARWFEENVLDE